MSNAAAASVQTAAYGVERTKQETGVGRGAINSTATDTKDDFQSKVDEAAKEAHVKKEAAVSEGKADVEHAKAATVSYIDQARGLVDTALGTAQSYVTAGQERLGANTTHSTAHVKSTGGEGPKSGSLADTISGVAISALQTTKVVLATAQDKLAATGHSAHDTVKPHVDNTATAAQPHVEATQGTAQPHVDAVAAAAKPHVESAQATAQPHIETAKQSLPNSVVDTSTPSSTAAATGSISLAETTTGTSSIASPTTISYPSEPKTESHHVTTEPSTAPERVDDRAVEKLADGLTSTKITDVAPASTV